MKKLLVSVLIPEAVLSILTHRYQLVTEDGGMHETIETALLTVMDDCSKERLSKLPALRKLVSIGAGLNHIDRDYCSSNHIQVLNTPHTPARATAEIAMGLMIDLLRSITAGDRYVRAGEWTKNPSSITGTELFGKTLGILGLGNIGFEIARKAKAFDMTIIYHNRRPRQDIADLAEYRTFDALLAESDVLIVQLPYSKETHHIVNQSALGKMKPEACLINTGRGGLVDDAALAAALREGRIRGAALDVVENEPDVNSELLKLPNVIVTPHIGTSAPGVRMAMIQEALALV